jgi:hypothetical protein
MRGLNVKQVVVLLALFSVTLIGRVAGAVPVVEDKDKGIVVNVGALLQPTFQMTAPAGSGVSAPCGTEAADRHDCSAGIGNPHGGPNYDLFLRRARIMVWGTATKNLAFFIETDEPNLGKGGDYTPRTFVQDAFLSYTIDPAFKIDAGLMLAPLSHQTLEGATSLNQLDYHTAVIQFPAGRVFRDTGIQFRGLLLKDHLHYRVAVLEGVRNGALPAVPAGETRPALNPGGVPRLTGQIRANILGSEPDFFFKGIYFSEKPIVTVGVGGDWQAKSAIKASGSRRDYGSISGDVFVEYPFSADDELLIQANYFYYAPGTVPGTTVIPQGASTGYAQVGFRHAFIEPLVFGEVVKGFKNSISSVAPHLGVNFWIMKHNFNIKTDVGYRRTEPKGEETRKDIIWTTQGQVFF